MKTTYVEYNKMLFKINSFEYKPGVFIVKRVKPEANQSHVVKIINNKAYCDCQGFKFRGICNHIHSIYSFLKEVK